MNSKIFSIFLDCLNIQIFSQKRIEKQLFLIKKYKNIYHNMQSPPETKPRAQYEKFKSFQSKPTPQIKILSSDKRKLSRMGSISQARLKMGKFHSFDHQPQPNHKNKKLSPHYIKMQQILNIIKALVREFEEILHGINREIERTISNVLFRVQSQMKEFLGEKLQKIQHKLPPEPQLPKKQSIKKLTTIGKCRSLATTNPSTPSTKDNSSMAPVQLKEKIKRNCQRISSLGREAEIHIESICPPILELQNSNAFLQSPEASPVNRHKPAPDKKGQIPSKSAGMPFKGLKILRTTNQP